MAWFSTPKLKPVDVARGRAAGRPKPTVRRSRLVSLLICPGLVLVMPPVVIGLAPIPALANCTAISAECGEPAVSGRLLLPEIVVAMRSIEDPRQRLAVIAKIARVASRLGETSISRAMFAEATDGARQVADPFERVLDLMLIASTHADVGEADMARSLFSEAAMAAASAPDTIGRDAARYRLAIGQAGAGQFAEALAVARDIEQSYYRAPALSGIAGVYASSGDMASAVSLFKEALAGIAEIPVAGGLRSARHIEVLHDIAVARARAGDVDGARETIALIPATSRDWPLRLVVQVLAQRGDVENALLVARDIGPAQSNHAQRDVIQALVVAGEIAKAIATSEALFPHGTVDHHEAAVMIAIAQAQAGHPEDARDTAAEILLNARGPDRPTGLAPAPDDGLGSLLGTIWSAEGENAATRRRDSVLIAIASAEATAGKPEQAFDTVDGISDPLLRIMALIDVNMATGRPREALSAALSADIARHGVSALAHLIDALSGQENEPAAKPSGP